MRWSAWRDLLITYLAPRRRLAAVLGAALLASIVLQVATPQAVRLFVDRATSPAPRPLLPLATLYILAVLAQQGFRLLAAWLGEVLGWLTTNELRADLLAHCLSLDPEFHTTHTPGELIERVDGDVNGLALLFSQVLVSVLGNLLLLGGVLGVVTVQSRPAGIALSAFAAAALLSLTTVRRISAPAWERAREASAMLFGYLEERLAGTQDIRASGAEGHTLRGFYALARDKLWRTSRARVMDAIPWAVNGLIGCGTHAVAFVIPAVLVGRGTLSVGEAFVIYFYAQLLLQPLHDVSDQVQQLQQAIAGGRRVAALFALEPTILDDVPAPGGHPGATLEPGALAVSFADVRFGYGDDADVLHGVTIDVVAGGVIGIVGRTGSGKSSLARLLVRLHDVRDGRVEVGGVDVRTLARSDLRRRVALVTQDVHILRASLRDNLTWFDPDVPDAAVADALEQLGLAGWAAALPDGLDTVLREGGAGLSAGESQLVSLGRALLTDPSVVVLDEASSRLDPATERVLEDAIDRLLAGRTGILIAHRLATLGRCDTICVLDHGRVVEHGRRPDLAADPESRFAALLRAGLDAVAT